MSVDIGITRAQFAVNANFWNPGAGHEPPNGYDQSGQNVGWDGKLYRTDCSGFYSMALGIGVSPISSDFARMFQQISWAELQCGDTVTASADENNGEGHVVAFLSWANSDQTVYNAAEFGWGTNPLHRQIPVPYDDPRSFKPYRAPFNDVRVYDVNTKTTVITQNTQKKEEVVNDIKVQNKLAQVFGLAATTQYTRPDGKTKYYDFWHGMSTIRNAITHGAAWNGTDMSLTNPATPEDNAVRDTILVMGRANMSQFKDKNGKPFVSPIYSLGWYANQANHGSLWSTGA